MVAYEVSQTEVTLRKSILANNIGQVTNAVNVTKWLAGMWIELMRRYLIDINIDFHAFKTQFSLNGSIAPAGVNMQAIRNTL